MHEGVDRILTELANGGVGVIVESNGHHPCRGALVAADTLRESGADLIVRHGSDAPGLAVPAASPRHTNNALRRSGPANRLLGPQLIAALRAAAGAGPEAATGLPITGTHPQGVVARPEVLEASVDAATLAGRPAVALVSPLADRDPAEFALDHGLAVCSVGELVTHRWRTETFVSREVEARLPTRWGPFLAVGFRSLVDDSEHVALTRGELDGRSGVLARVHSECLTGDVFASERCDCGRQLHLALERIAAADRGVVVYDRSHEGRGIGLFDKLEAYRLQDTGLDTVEANLQLGFPPDARHYGHDAQILRDLGIASVRLMTNNPDKIAQLEALGVVVAERIPHDVGSTVDSRGYLDTKVRKLGHLLGDGPGP